MDDELDLLCRNSLHPRTGPGPCPECRADPGAGVVNIGVQASRKLIHDISPGYRMCTKCMQLKPLNGEYFYRQSRLPEGFHSQCKDCLREYGREWRQRANDVGGGRVLYRRKALRRYNMTLDGFLALLEQQGGRCAICPSTDPRGADWAIDHDHSCCPAKKRSCGACVRGLLCVPCNVGLAFFGDDPERLAAAAVYMQRYLGRTT